MNIYSYCGNKVTGWVDPTGLILRVCGSDEFKKQVESYLNQIRNTNSGDELIDKLEASDRVNTIKETNKGNSTEGYGNTVSDTDINYNPSLTAPYGQSGYSRSPETGLVHEMGHAADYNTGVQAAPPKIPGPRGTTPSSEKSSMKYENLYRNETGQKNRDSYF